MQFTNFPEIENVREYCTKYECGIESFDFVAREVTLTDDASIERLRREFGKVSSIHGPYKGLDYSSSDEEIMKKTYDEYQRFYRIAVELECEKVIVHNMWDPEAEPKGHERSVKFWKRFLEEHKGVKFCLENIIDMTPDLLVDLHDEIDSSDLGICLDVGHVNVNVGDKVVDWIKSYGHRLAHVHLHNNKGEADDHSGLNDGTIDMLKALTELKKHLPTKHWNIETSCLQESFDWLVCHGFIK